VVEESEASGLTRLVLLAIAECSGSGDGPDGYEMIWNGDVQTIARWCRLGVPVVAAIVETLVESGDLVSGEFPWGNPGYHLAGAERSYARVERRRVG
jgi:hypothetical protein